MTQEKRETIDNLTDKHGFGFRLRWKVSDTWADVEAFDISSIGDDGPMFHRKGAASWPDDVRTIEEAEPYLTGYVKWDGCTELDQGCPHWCGPRSYRKHMELLEFIYHRAHELMGLEPESSWDQWHYPMELTL